MDERQRQRPIRLFDLAYACSIYARVTGFDESYARFVKATSKPPDLARADHRKALLVWLNSWGCRQFALKWHCLASENIRLWYDGYRHTLPATDKDLWELSRSELAEAETAYASLSNLTASRYTRKDKPELLKKTAGPTGAAKILFALRPRAFLAWDGPIREHFGYDGSAASYLAYLKGVVRALKALEAECRLRGLQLTDLPRELGTRSPSVVQLIDMYYWITITRGWHPPDSSTLRRWVEWDQP